MLLIDILLILAGAAFLLSSIENTNLIDTVNKWVKGDFSVTPGAPGTQPAPVKH